LPGSLRGFAAPELLHHRVARDDLPGAEREKRDQRAMLLAPQHHDPTAVAKLEGAKEEYLHGEIVRRVTSIKR
jgi:hypothetical protein